ncbi:hypothetical protein [Nocardia sp. NPDC050406]|uniref:hypothetical protein n=1 Tax=Nocardia sp. NPDC050406 TaxID=3364318 RepID=UPI0037A9B198
MPISFDTSGLQQQDANRWVNPATRDMVSVQYFDLAPDLPAALEDLDTLRQRLAQHRADTGCLIEAFVVGVDGQPALLRMEKMPLPDQPTGLIFAASLVVPKQQCSATLTLLCPEAGPTGMREAMLAAQIGFQNMYPPHPYAPGLQGKLPYNAADDIRWDAQFPEHPLTRARQWIARTVPGMRLDPGFAALPPFRG